MLSHETTYITKLVSFGLYVAICLISIILATIILNVSLLFTIQISLLHVAIRDTMCYKFLFLSLFKSISGLKYILFIRLRTRAGLHEASCNDKDEVLIISLYRILYRENN